MFTQDEGMGGWGHWSRRKLRMRGAERRDRSVTHFPQLELTLGTGAGCAQPCLSPPSSVFTCTH